MENTEIKHNYRPTQFGQSASADFEESTMTFLMQDGYKVASGQYAIMDKVLFDEIMAYLEKRDKEGGNGSADATEMLIKIESTLTL